MYVSTRGCAAVVTSDQLHSHSPIELHAYTIWHRFQLILYGSRLHQRNSVHLSQSSCEESPCSETPEGGGCLTTLTAG